MQKKNIRKPLSVMLAAAMLTAMFVPASASVNASGDDTLLSVKIADVTIRYTESADILDAINDLRYYDYDQDEYVLDWDFTAACITRAAELPISFSTVSLSNEDYNNTADDTNISGAMSYEFVFEYDENQTPAEALNAAVADNPEYAAKLFTEDLDVIGIGVVSVNGSTKRYACIRTTNLFTLRGQEVSQYTSDNLRRFPESTQTRRTKAYYENLNLDLNEYTNYKMTPGQTVSVKFKAKGLDKRNDFAYIMPEGNTADNTNVFYCTPDNSDVKALVPGSSVINFRLNAADYGATGKTIRYTFISEGDTLADCVADDIEDQEYTGNAIEPKPVIRTADGELLTEGTDYTLSYQDNILAGTAKVIATGAGKYLNTQKVIKFKIISPLNVGLVLPSGTIKCRKYYTLSSEISGASGDTTITYTMNGQELTTLEDGTADFLVRTPGKYTFGVTVTDQNGNSATDTAEVTVADAISVTLSSSANNIAVGSSSVFTATSNTAVRYVFEKTGTTNEVLQDGSSATYTFTPSEAGRYTIKVTAYDADGDSEDSSVNITAYDELRATLTVSSERIFEGQSVDIHVDVSGGSGSYINNIRIGGAPLVLDSEGNATYTPAEIGSYVLTMNISDGAGNSVSDSKTIEVVSPVSVKAALNKKAYRSGEDVTVTTTSSGATKFNFDLVSGEEVTVIQQGTFDQCTFKAGEAGTYTLKVTAFNETNDSATDEVTFTVYDEDIKNTSTISAETAEIGDTITLTGSAEGGVGNHSYTYLFKRSSESEWSYLGSGDSASFKPTTAGTFNFRVYAKDEAGSVACKGFTTRFSGPLVNISSASAYTFKLGEKISIRGAAIGGSGRYTFSYDYKRNYETTWKHLSWGNEYTFMPSNAGKFNIRIYAKDTEGAVSVKSITVEAIGDLVNQSSVSTTSMQTGETANIYCGATGGTGTYTYTCQYKLPGYDKWLTLGNKKVLEFKPEMSGVYNFRVYVKDQSGTTVCKSLYIKVDGVLTNISTLDKAQIKLGETAHINCAAAGGSGRYFRSTSIKRADSTEWTTLGNTDTIDYTPTEADTYNIRVYIRDTDGTTVCKSLTLKVE